MMLMHRLINSKNLKCNNYHLEKNAKLDQLTSEIMPMLF